jgi:hypothetical protein
MRSDIEESPSYTRDRKKSYRPWYRESKRSVLYCEMCEFPFETGLTITEYTREVRTETEGEYSILCKRCRLRYHLLKLREAGT